MCTLSIIPRFAPAGNVEGFSAIVNRDESHFRAPAKPPQLRIREGVRAVMPIDTDAGGTWVAVNDHAIVYALLNYAPGSKPGTAPRGPHSRGLIIPDLISARTLADAHSAALALRTSSISPFRLILASAASVHELISPGFGEPLITRSHQLSAPLVFASSGLGDDLVEPARRELARGLFSVAPWQWPEAQTALHRHRWPDRPEISVYMHRHEARTVSITSITVSTGLARMTYQAELVGRFAPAVTADLPLQRDALGNARTHSHAGHTAH